MKNTMNFTRKYLSDRTLLRQGNDHDNEVVLSAHTPSEAFEPAMQWDAPWCREHTHLLMLSRFMETTNHHLELYRSPLIGTPKARMMRTAP
ncbi:hypothetical protein AB1N83_006854 [Pleurotus pulmonarius]